MHILSTIVKWAIKLSIEALCRLAAGMKWLLPPGREHVPSFFAMYVFLAVCVYALGGAREHVTVISSFTVPPDKNLPFAGETIANVFLDSLMSIGDELRETEEWLQARSGQRLDDTGIESWAKARYGEL